MKVFDKALEIAKKFLTYTDSNFADDYRDEISLAQALLALAAENEMLGKEIPFLKSEVDKWKDEYRNVCKFATDYEQQRDDLQSQLAKAEDILRHYNGLRIEVIRECGDGICEVPYRINLYDKARAYFAESAAEKKDTP